MAETRKIRDIAQEIRTDWTKVYFGAEPYLNAMELLSSPSDYYGADSGSSIVAYFLANAGTWRGEVARRVKAELRGMV